ncbi:MAG: alpha/beta fold hydrolase [Candidatus Obscuribacterales bacterium]|nr:alpha/beta fold hydrolase [Candidatus Obscuribacterales bacterium]
MYWKVLAIAISLILLVGSSPLGMAKISSSQKSGKVRGDVPCLAWVRPGVPTKAVLLCVHGLGLNSKSWQTFGDKMSAQGLPTYAIDVRGFGSWMEAKGHKDVDFKACIEDLRGTLEWISKAHYGKPIFLVGESMGGAIVLQCAAAYPDLMSGVISACASGDRFKEKKMNLAVALHLVAGGPRRGFDIGKSVVNQATQNPELREQWAEDPLNRMDLSPRDLVQFQAFMNRNHDAAKEIKNLPVLMVQGSKDGLVKPEGTEELYQELATKEKEMIMVPNSEHLIFEEGQCSDQVLEQVAQWISKYSTGARLVETDPVSQSTSLLVEAREALKEDKLSLAIKTLHAAAKRSAKDPEVHYLLGIAHYKAHHPLLAFRNFRLARRYAKAGSAVSKKANAMMMSLPQSLVQSDEHGLLLPSNQIFGKKPAVVLFNAKWCEPCKDMTATTVEIEKRYGDKLLLQTIDVDDPNNEGIVDYFAIGPVPTTVFLTEQGDVVQFQVGYAGLDGMIKGIEKILPSQ